MANHRNRYPQNSMPNPWQGGAIPGMNRPSQLAYALNNLFNMPPMGGPGGPPGSYQQFDRRGRLPPPPGRKMMRPQGNASRNHQQNNKKSNDNSQKESNDVKADKNGDAETEPQEGGDKKEGRYVGIPQSYLKCAICEKSMWDGESFEKHLRGRAHALMCESLDESFRIQADMMRQVIRLAEERKAIELNRQKRNGKRVDMRKVSQCNMCNFEFYGREAEHRRSEGHQKLKRFLHPRCKRCRVEFSTKIEWEEHRLSPDHIRKIIEMKDQSDTASIDIDLHDGVMDLNIDVDEYEADDINPDNVIVDYNDSTDIVTDFENRIPCYKRARSLGESLIHPVQGFLCKICNRFFDSEVKVQNHGKSREHYDNFVKLLRSKHSEKVKPPEEQGNKHEMDDDDNESAKRIKLEKENPEGAELYDPMEAEEDDEKVKEEATLEGIAAEEALLNEDVSGPEVKVKEEEEAKEQVQPVAEVPQPLTRTTRRTSKSVAAATPTKPGPASKTRSRN